MTVVYMDKVPTNHISLDLAISELTKKSSGIPSIVLGRIQSCVLSSFGVTSKRETNQVIKTQNYVTFSETHILLSTYMSSISLTSVGEWCPFM